MDSHDYKRAYEMQKKAREIAEKRLEDKSRELYGKNKSLENALIKLDKQQEEIIAQEKLASVGQLAAGLAHELNNPNSFIKNNLSTLKEYVSNLIKGLESSFSTLNELKMLPCLSAHIESINNAIRSIEDASDIQFIKDDLNDIIDESLKGSKRIETIANSLEYFSQPDLSDPKLVDLNECIVQAQKLINKELMRTFNIQFKLGDLPNISGTPLLITQALSNVFINALEAQPKSDHISVESTHQKDKVIISVKDDGVGISPEKLETVFHPFVTDSNKKHGLGLNIAQSIIIQHKGSIYICSEEGKGTTVMIEFPTKPD